jgi:hypothetical protein
MRSVPIRAAPRVGTEHFEPLIRSVLAAPKRSIYNY